MAAVADSRPISNDMTAGPSAGASMVASPSSDFLEKMLGRIDAQLDDIARAKSQGQAVGLHESEEYRRAGIGIALAHAAHQIEALPRSTTGQALQSRLTSVKQKYSVVFPLQTTSAKLKPHSFRDYLIQDVVDDADSDEEYEADLRAVASGQSHKTDDLSKRVAGATAAVDISNATHSEPRDPEKAASFEEEEDGMEVYEAAAALRRRNKESSKGAQEAEANKPADDEKAPTALQSERGIQDALSGELLRMAGILKTNSVRFADALERDRQALEEAGEKLQGNLTLMTRTRGRLGEYSRKARSMGWMTLGSVAVVCMSWILMFIVIRLT